MLKMVGLWSKKVLVDMGGYLNVVIFLSNSHFLISFLAYHEGISINKVSAPL